ncbi:hypothetical protein C7C56_006105 [Massilia glaciei]|uniref:DNA polymerase III subunit gamma/tau n=1 Tax=Massilia glaciei TaxID=1524097 RepID=A0A2U2I4B3_9BURK|nr:hypothetical protein C7C56_006105 [Massilia glaciei]
MQQAPAARPTAAAAIVEARIAALEAARAGSRGQNVAPKRPTAMSNQAAANAAPPAAQELASASASASAPAPAPAQAQAPALQEAPKQAPPWEQAAAPAQQQAAQPRFEPESQDEPPSWVMEFSDDSAVSGESSAPPPAATRAPAAPRPEYVITPVPAIGWDGNWPALAATLPLRGVSQQLALQTEMASCEYDGNLATFRLRVPIDTLRASGNSEKLAAALQACFPDAKVAVEIDIGQVFYTAGAEAQAYREECQRVAEDTVANDPFVKDVIRDLGAFVVPGSVRPASAAAA